MLYQQDLNPDMDYHTVRDQIRERYGAATAKAIRSGTNMAFSYPDRIQPLRPPG